MADLLHALAAQAAGHDPTARAAPPLRPNGSLADALRRQPTLPPAERALSLAVIAELKLASPSEGPLLAGDPHAYLAAVRAGGACAVSAVTAAGRFGGSLDVLRAANATGLPTLMKDFVAQPAQLDAAAHHGASAVLLIERLLGADARETLVRAAHDRGLEVLLEAHGASEAAAVRASRADALGINSRDLDTLAIDVPAALAAVRSLSTARPDVPVLLLSGVDTAIRAEAARAVGAAGILVGTGLLRSRVPGTTLRALRRSIVKVCGNQTSTDVASAVAAGADLVGVIVGTSATRDVPLPIACRLLEEARAAGVAAVAVTRDASATRLHDLAAAVRPDAVQVHGPLEPAGVAALHGLGVAVLQAIVPGQVPVFGVDGTVTDTTAGGGSGRRHDGRVPTTPGLHLVAGGLEAANAANAVTASGAAGADASGRLESNGRKDPSKVRAFVAAARAAARTHGAAPISTAALDRREGRHAA